MKALICLTYDDALPVHRQAVAHDLSRRGLRGTFYVPAAYEDLHAGLEGWREVAALGHELGNHSCWHPCRTRPEWKPPYRLEDYDRRRVRDELLMANRVLHLIDGRTERSYGATCGDLTCGPGEGEFFLDDVRDLFRVVRSGHRDGPMVGAASLVVPAFHADHCRADEIVAVVESMKSLPESWMLIGLHGVGAGTHHDFIDSQEHQRLIDWIAAQCDWLEAVTVLEAVARRGRAAEKVTTGSR
jgi:hypothetical protein